jgi:hypothetical protein
MELQATIIARYFCRFGPWGNRNIRLIIWHPPKN